MKGRFQLLHSRVGFTLLELLAAAVVFMILAGVCFRIFGSVSEVSRHHERKADAAASCRGALDALSQDVGTLVTRGGATLLFKPGGANTSDELRFLCFSRPMAEHPTARMTIVAYRMDTRRHAALKRDLPMLVRGNAPVFWVSGSDTVDYRFPEVLADRALTYEDLLSDRVFRFQVVWIRTDGQITHDPRGSSVEDSAMEVDGDGYIWIDLKEVRGFIVSLVAVDAAAQERVEDYAALQRSFPAVLDLEAAQTKVPAAMWHGGINQLEPSFLRAAVHVAQRTYFFHR